MLIIGLGTGRCGTMSLAHLLNHQDGCACTHELTFDSYKFIVPPLNIKKQDMADDYLNRVYNRTLPIKADISLWWLTFVDHIVDKYKDDVRLLCLRRDREATIQSYIKKLNINGPNGMNHMVEHDGTFWARNPWDVAYPKYDAKTLPEALGMYWDDYYTRGEAFQKKYPDKFKVIDLPDLNDADKVLEILNFCNIPNPKVVFKHSNIAGRRAR
jgi:hypothetical protein